MFFRLSILIMKRFTHRKVVSFLVCGVCVCVLGEGGGGMCFVHARACVLFVCACLRIVCFVCACVCVCVFVCVCVCVHGLLYNHEYILFSYHGEQMCMKITSKNKESIASFRFPKAELLEQWTRFVNRPDWTPSSNSVLCQNHFEDKFIIRRKRNKLRWDLNPVPTIHSKETLKTIPQHYLHQ